MIKLLEENILGKAEFHIAETVLESSANTQKHTHDFYEIFIIKEGEINHSINGKSVFMKKGDLYFVKPSDEHSFQKVNCRKALFVNFAFSAELFKVAEKIARQYFEMKGKFSRVEAHVPSEMEASLLSKLVFLSREKSLLFSVSQKGMLLSIVLECLLILDGQTDRRMNAPEWLDHACLEMKKNMNYLEGISKFVELSGKSQEHLTRTMKKYYQITPTKYVNHIKIEHAAILLNTTDKKVLDIMFECGFNNVAHFIRLFKKSYGITPRSYRALNYSVINPV